MLKEYATAFGVSGCEGEIRSIIKNGVEGIGDISIDKIGNLIVHKKGNGKKVMLAAHMDEVGFIVTDILNDGRIKFAPVGGIDTRILPSKRVIFGRSNLKGVIGAKPIHLQPLDERKKPFSLKDLFIDIGAQSLEEASKFIRIGDYAVFESEYIELDEVIKCKALDDRVGCALIYEALKDNYKFDLYAAFTVQEEVGLRGAEVAAKYVMPEIAIILEGTTCADIAKEERDFVTTLGGGPAISIMDRTSTANINLMKRIVEIAKNNNIPFQYRKGNVGGNDAGIIHKTGTGCITATISVPTRYIHSPVSMINKKDFENTLKLLKLVLYSLEED
ncbi:MAG: M42 family metallopeptidase [Caloramator sp.]|nr:M42 family metallopeptidase [Caloramator sp.]